MEEKLTQQIQLERFIFLLETTLERLADDSVRWMWPERLNRKPMRTAKA